MQANTTEHGPLSAPLDEYVRQYQDLRNDAAELTSGLSDHQLNWSPAPGKWSIAQCLDHLNSVARQYLEPMAAGIATAREQGLTSGRPVRYGFLERWMIRSMEPPPRQRVKAPGKFRPAAEAQPLDATQVLADYANLKDRLIELLASADGLDVGRQKITSPVSKLIRLRIGAAFAFLASHERRHVWQARQVRESSEFPDG